MREIPIEGSFFSSNGFERRICSRCGSAYWTRDSSRTTCGDPPCDTYSFIGSSGLKAFTVDEMRKAFIDFFRETHGVVEPYPVVPRWREDVLLVNASIYDFQPHVTSGMAEPPSNPLVMSQPCIRMLDVDLVGLTGRHLTSFEMMCHDAFNRPGKYVYWREETISYCFRFLTEVLHVDPVLITFKEKPWSGGGNGGNAVEVFVKGLEVATLVFMDMKEDPEGDFEIDGTHYSRMERKIIDTGYGLERLAWLTSGTPTIYDTLYGEPMEFVYRKLGLDRPEENLIALNSIISSQHPEYGQSALFSAVIDGAGIPPAKRESALRSLEIYRNVSMVVDHGRTALLILKEKVLPSNVKVGYVLRFLIRGMIKALKSLGGEDILLELLELELSVFSNILRDTDFGFVRMVVSEEMRKYNDVMERGGRIIGKLVEQKGRLEQKDLIKLYDSNGIDPETAAGIYQQLTGRSIEVAENFRNLVSSLHGTSGKRKENEKYPDIATRPLYYDDTRIRDFTGIVMYSRGGKVILNQTAFYPEGGGQPCDLGYFQRGNSTYQVRHVEKHGQTIVHHVEGEIEERWRLQGHIDYDRRWQLMIHHSATHLLLAVLREVLGDHVWQIGVQKGVDSSRIDISHFARLDSAQIRTVEERCLKLIQENRKITARFVEWNHALEKFGFRLFQGGVPVEGRLRVVEIEGIDAEGCGGTHLSSTGPIGLIKIISSDTLQENVQRITFVAGPALLRYVTSLQESMKSISETTRSDHSSAPEKVRTMQEELLSLRKRLDEDRKERVSQILAQSRRFMGRNGETLAVSFRGEEEDIKFLIGSLNSINASTSVILNEKNNQIYVISRGPNRSDQILRTILDGKIPKEAKLGERFSSSPFKGKLDESLIRKYLL